MKTLSLVLICVSFAAIGGCHPVHHRVAPASASANAPSGIVAVALQYSDANTLIGANIVTDSAMETVIFENTFRCVQWARVKVAAERPKTIGYSCLPIPGVGAQSTSRALADSSGLPAVVGDIAVDFQYGTTHQLVKVDVLGRARDNADCVAKGNATLAASQVPPGWIVMIRCMGVPRFPSATGTL